MREIVDLVIAHHACHSSNVPPRLICGIIICFPAVTQETQRYTIGLCIIYIISRKPMLTEIRVGSISTYIIILLAGLITDCIAVANNIHYRTTRGKDYQPHAHVLNPSMTNKLQGKKRLRRTDVMAKSRRAVCMLPAEEAM